MATELGIGVRVWVGYTDKVGVDEKPYMCRQGVVIDGPQWVNAGLYKLPDGKPWLVTRSARYWRVLIDGARLWAEEPLLFPLDDGDPAAERERADRGEGVEA